MKNEADSRVNYVANTSQIYHRVLVVIFASCLSILPAQLLAETDRASLTRPLIIQNVDASITEATISGPLFEKSVGFHSFESSKSARVKHLRDEYELEEVVGSAPVCLFLLWNCTKLYGRTRLATLPKSRARPSSRSNEGAWLYFRVIHINTFNRDCTDELV